MENDSGQASYKEMQFQLASGEGQSTFKLRLVPSKGVPRVKALI